MVFLSGVDNEFLHIWIAVHKVRESELNLQSGGKGSGECLALQVPNNVDVNFYLLDKNKAYWAKQLPGFRESGNRIISIATHANKFYWLPSSNLITQRLYCQKLPGKCLYWTDDKYDLEKHERICTDESIIRAKQVN